MDIDVNSRNYDNYVDIDGKPVRRVTHIEVPPTDPSKTNPSGAISPTTDGYVTTIVSTKVIGGVTYTRTDTYNSLTGAFTYSVWT